VANGRASVHHVLPRTGWVTYYLHGPDSVGSPLPVCTGLIGLTSLGWRGRSPLSLSHQLLISIEIWKRKLDHI
jgi:hypothetical protein